MSVGGGIVGREPHHSQLVVSAASDQLCRCGPLIASMQLILIFRCRNPQTRALQI
jgi:hypothetical protein